MLESSLESFVIVQRVKTKQKVPHRTCSQLWFFFLFLTKPLIGMITEQFWTFAFVSHHVWVRTIFKVAYFLFEALRDQKIRFEVQFTIPMLTITFPMPSGIFVFQVKPCQSLILFVMSIFFSNKVQNYYMPNQSLSIFVFICN